MFHTDYIIEAERLAILKISLRVSHDVLCLTNVVQKNEDTFDFEMWCSKHFVT